MEYLLIAISALLISWIAFYSGFGLGTILMPVIAIFFPIPIAISLTAMIHFFHSVFKTAIFWKSIHWKVAVHFGGMALIVAIFGALLLSKLSRLQPLTTYSFYAIQGKISLLALLLGAIFISLATLSLFPNQILRIKNLFLGGAISGFFGGLSGNQGAFRSIFIFNLGLDKRAFLGTSAIISSAVDIARLVIYSISFQSLFKEINPFLMTAAIGGAFGGICLGTFFLQKITVEFIQKLIVFLLYFFGALFILGIL